MENVVLSPEDSYWMHVLVQARYLGKFSIHHQCTYHTYPTCPTPKYITHRLPTNHPQTPPPSTPPSTPSPAHVTLLKPPTPLGPSMRRASTHPPHHAPTHDTYSLQLPSPLYSNLRLTPLHTPAQHVLQRPLATEKRQARFQIKSRPPPHRPMALPPPRENRGVQEMPRSRVARGVGADQRFER